MEFSTLKDDTSELAMDYRVMQHYGCYISPSEFRHIVKLALFTRYPEVPLGHFKAFISKPIAEDFFSNLEVVTDTPRRVTPQELLSDIYTDTNGIEISAIFIDHGHAHPTMELHRYLHAIRSRYIDSSFRIYGFYDMRVRAEAEESLKSVARLLCINKRNIDQVLLVHKYDNLQHNIITRWLSSPRTTLEQQVAFCAEAYKLAKADGSRVSEIQLAKEHTALIGDWNKTLAYWERILA